MYKLEYKSTFYDDLKTIVKDKSDRKRILKKLQDMKCGKVSGKKLKHNAYWSLRIGRFRIIYQKYESKLVFFRIILREHNYKELGTM